MQEYIANPQSHTLSFYSPPERSPHSPRHPLYFIQGAMTNMAETPDQMMSTKQTNPTSDHSSVDSIEAPRSQVSLHIQSVHDV